MSQYIDSESDAPLKVDSIDIFWLEDSEASLAETSLGSYSETLNPGGIDRRKRPEFRGTEYSFWNPANYDPEHPEYAEQDYQRHEALCRGEWSYQGCVAQATVSYPVGSGSRRLEFLRSGALYGIESDSESSYLAQVVVEQLEDLKEHLSVFGVPWSANEESILLDARRKAQELSSRRTHESID